MTGGFLLWYARRGWGSRFRRSAFRKFCRPRRGLAFTARTVDGVVMETVLGDSVDNAIYVYGVFEPTTSELFRRLSPLVRGLVDVGCNIGYFSCLFRRLNPLAPIVAIDANPRMVERTHRNLSMNGYDNITMVPRGMAATEGHMTLHVPRDRHSLASFAYQPGSEKSVVMDSVEVEVSTLSCVIRDAGLDAGLFIKIDTEGFEHAVLSGLDISDTGCVDALLIEVNHRNLARAGITLEKLLGFGWLQGFHWFEVDDHLGRFGPVTRNSLVQRTDLNTNLLFLRPALAAVIGERSSSTAT